jgi:hypothetical protein
MESSQDSSPQDTTPGRKRVVNRACQDCNRQVYCCGWLYGVLLMFSSRRKKIKCRSSALRSRPKNNHADNGLARRSKASSVRTVSSSRRRVHLSSATEAAETSTSPEEVTWTC